MIGRLWRLLLIFLLAGWLLNFLLGKRQKQVINSWFNRLAILLILSALAVIIFYSLGIAI